MKLLSACLGVALWSVAAAAQDAPRFAGRSLLAEDAARQLDAGPGGGRCHRRSRTTSGSFTGPDRWWTTRRARRIAARDPVLHRGPAGAPVRRRTAG